MCCLLYSQYMWMLYQIFSLYSFCKFLHLHFHHLSLWLLKEAAFFSPHKSGHFFFSLFCMTYPHMTISVTCKIDLCGWIYLDWEQIRTHCFIQVTPYQRGSREAELCILLLKTYPTTNERRKWESRGKKEHCVT